MENISSSKMKQTNNFMTSISIGLAQFKPGKINSRFTDIFEGDQGKGIPIYQNYFRNGYELTIHQIS